MFVKPAALPPELAARFPAGEAPSTLRVRDPRLGDFIPADGRDVPLDPYFVRRLRDGDLVEAEPPQG